MNWLCDSEWAPWPPHISKVRSIESIPKNSVFKILNSLKDIDINAFTLWSFTKGPFPSKLPLRHLAGHFPITLKSFLWYPHEPAKQYMSPWANPWEVRNVKYSSCPSRLSSPCIPLGLLNGGVKVDQTHQAWAWSLLGEEKLQVSLK